MEKYQEREREWWGEVVMERVDTWREGVRKRAEGIGRIGGRERGTCKKEEGREYIGREVPEFESHLVQ